MRNNIKLLIGLSILIMSGCSKSEISNSEGEFTNDMPTIPDSIEIDIDENGTVDFSIIYSTVLVEGPTVSGGIVGVLEIHGENEILKERQENSLFLRNIEEIRLNVSEPLFWNNSSRLNLVSIYNHSPTNEWRTKWEINSEMNFSSYFVGLKMINNNVSQLAWIELEINTDNGNISIINKGLI